MAAASIQQEATTTTLHRRGRPAGGGGHRPARPHAHLHLVSACSANHGQTSEILRRTLDQQQADEPWPHEHEGFGDSGQ